MHDRGAGEELFASMDRPVCIQTRLLAPRANFHRALHPANQDWIVFFAPAGCKSAAAAVNAWHSGGPGQAIGPQVAQRQQFLVIQPFAHSSLPLCTLQGMSPPLRPGVVAFGPTTAQAVEAAGFSPAPAPAPGLTPCTQKQPHFPALLGLLLLPLFVIV